MLFLLSFFYSFQVRPWYSFLPNFKDIVYFFPRLRERDLVSTQCDLPQSLDPWRGGTAVCPSDGKHLSVQPVWIWLLVALAEGWKWTLKYFLCHTAFSHLVPIIALWSGGTNVMSSPFYKWKQNKTKQNKCPKNLSDFLQIIHAACELEFHPQFLWLQSPCSLYCTMLLP